MDKPLLIKDVALRVVETESAIANGLVSMRIDSEDGSNLSFVIPITALNRLLNRIPPAIALMERRQAHPLRYKEPH